MIRIYITINTSNSSKNKIGDSTIDHRANKNATVLYERSPPDNDFKSLDSLASFDLFG